MAGKALYALCAITLLAGCNAQEDSNQAESPNTLIESAETRTGAAAPASDAPADQISMAAVPRETALRLMHERHEKYEEIGDAMKVITRELRAGQPDLAAVRQGADTIATLAPMIPSWFPAGTGPDVGETHARAEIWQRPEDFSAKAQTLEEQANAFRDAARGTDVAAIRAAHAELGQACKACHDLYREKE